MFMSKQHPAMARMLGVAMLAALGLSGCATYDDEFATINSRLNQLDTMRALLLWHGPCPPAARGHRRMALIRRGSAPADDP